MVYRSKSEFMDKAALSLDGDGIAFLDREGFRTRAVDDVVETIILGDDPEVRDFAFHVVRQAAKEYKVYPHSIQAIYEARAKDNLTYFAVPAMNLRTLTYDLARAVFRSVAKIDAGTFIFEIARSEIGYTEQPPEWYAANVILAAVKEGYSGPVFIQGDHFQVNLKKFKADSDKEIQALKSLITDAVAAGFYNIDIDSSTLVDLSHKDISEQQRLNYEICAELTDYIRSIEPEGITISVGGEIGEVGGHNSTPEELRAFMQGFNAQIGEKTGLSKISIQTGTSHGGVVLPDGSIAKVKIDFDTLQELSRIAMSEFGMGGAVQHGASTLPKDAFHHFAERECTEVHLATQFQNIIYDHMPPELTEEIYNWLRANMSGERKEGQTEEQFLYKTRKKALGPFKRAIFSMPADLRAKISEALEAEFDFLFEQLKIKGTKELIDKYLPPLS
jgi:fructose/tagatose bisphosphate aldolase